MAHLVNNYDFGFPLKNVQQLDAIEQNILSDDKYATSLVKQFMFSFNSPPHLKLHNFNYHIFKKSASYQWRQRRQAFY